MIFNAILLCFSIVLTSGQFFNYLPLHFRINGRNYFHGNDQEQEPEPKLQIVNGDIARNNEATFVVFVEQEYDTSSGERYGGSCTGSLIDAETVLTAAHCVHESTLRNANGRVKIRYGTHNLKKPIFHDIAAKTVVVHRGYPSPGWINDIALIKLEQPVYIDQQYSKYVSFARLPEPNRYSYRLGTEAMAYGWGDTTQEALGIHPDYLGKTKLQIAYDPIINGFAGGTDSTWLYARSKTSTTCQGDSGGPLIVDNNVVIGVVSGRNFPPETKLPHKCPPNILARYVKVESFLEWILWNRYLLSFD